MLLRQLFNHPTFGYTYVLADPDTMDAAIIDPVKGKMRDYVQLFSEFGLDLKVAIDTHSHDDHASALGSLRDLWNCETVAGRWDEDITNPLRNGDEIAVGNMTLKAMHTPGHTSDSFSFLIERPDKRAVFTGDTLLVRTVGLSNQPTSNPRKHYTSLVDVLAKLPPDTIVYPGRDFKGWPLSTIREELAFNPYLLAGSLVEFVELKAIQKPADIRPLVVFREEDEQGTVSKQAAKPGDFYLPGERGLRSVDNSASDSDDNITSWR